MFQFPLSVSWVLGIRFHLSVLRSLGCGSHLWVGSQFLSLGSYLQSLMSRVSPTRWFPGLKSRIPPKVPSLWYHFLDMPLFAYKSWLHFCGRCSTVLSDVVYFEMFHLFWFSRIDFVGLAISVHAHLVDVIIATYTEFLKVFIILWYFVISCFFAPIQNGTFWGCSRMGDGGRKIALSLNSVTHILQW